MYSLNTALYGSLFVTPTVLVDKYIKLASFCAVKTLLWILRNQSGNFSVSELARAVGSSEADVKEALDYWTYEGVLVCDTDTKAVFSPTSSDSYLLNSAESSQNSDTKKDDSAQSSDNSINTSVNEASEELIIPTFEQVTARIEESREISGLINHVQIMLGRTTGYDFNAKLIQMVDGYGFPVEIVLRLIQYCIDIGKPSNAFIFSVAKNWYKNEITTLEQADAYINEHTKILGLFNEFKIYTGITAPKPTPKQEEYFIKWDQLGFKIDMIVLAYNITIENTGKIKFPYMDKILSDWHSKGLKTPDDVEADRNIRNTAKAQKTGRSYDIDKAITDADNDELVYEKKKKKKRSDGE